LFDYGSEEWSDCVGTSKYFSLQHHYSALCFDHRPVDLLWASDDLMHPPIKW